MFRGFFLIVSFVGFAPEAELKQTNICLLPTETGPCKANIGRFGFNPRVNRCEIFTYGGCGGNENNFLTFDACFARCGGDPELRCIEGSKFQMDCNNCTCEEGAAVCTLILCPEVDKCCQPIERGPCPDYIIKYGFDIENGKCVEFIYGGCYGNANNFETIEECISECGEILQS
ncbi:Boophilin-G2 [Armadillidium nasatum]|uniref:Boophilin-G2 n=1 Tax=Armadillidium nasatum TaxID=96803 RepID=A0A5N5T4G2_9CRUS|nr:Boophilin-G2 [Armadillidium nasatum]